MRFYIRSFHNDFCFRICEEIGIIGNNSDSNRINAEELLKVFEKLLLCMSDYSVDSRGDVGAW